MSRLLKPPRLHLLLGSLLALQVVLSVILFWPRGVSGDGSRMLFPDIAPGDFVQLTITDDAGKTLRLASVDGDWVLPEAGGYPVRQESVTSVLEAITGLESGRLVTRTEPSHRSLQVADDGFLRRVVFELADGSTGAIFLGSSPSYGQSHVRVFGQDEVYLTADLLTWNVGTNASSWIDTSYISVPRAEITGLTLTNANGTFEFTQELSETDGESTWSLVGLAEDEVLNDLNVGSLVNQAATINMIEPLGVEERAAYGLGSPAAVLTIETLGETISVIVGATDADDANYVVKSSTSPYYVRITKWNLSSLVDYAREDFLELLPTPAPEDQAGTPAPE